MLVRDMRHAYATGTVSFSQLSKLYDVSIMTAWSVVRRKNLEAR